MMRLSVRDRLLGTAFLVISLLNIPCGRMVAQIQPSPDLAAVPSLTGEFAKRVPFLAAPAFRVSEVPSSVLARDLNGDGKVDLIVASAATEQISVYMGLGQGKFSEPVTYNVGGHPVFVTTADISGDGEKDIVTANGAEGTVSVLAGVGGGKFAAARVYSTGVSADLLSLGDLSGGGKQDLVVASLTGKRFSVLLNDGQGSFQIAAIHALTSTPTALSMSDFNNDRRPDVAFAHADGTVTLLLGEGRGTFGAAKTFSVSSSKLSSLVSGDFNQDGNADLAVVQPDGHVVSIFSGQGDGTFVRGSSYQTGNGPISASMVDLRGNGMTDLVTVNKASNTFSVLMGNGDGTFKDALSFNAGDGPVGLAAGDFEGSGFTGLAIVNASAKTISVVAGNGDGSFKAARSYASDLSPRSIVSGDLNGDGRPDLLVANFCGSDAACIKRSTITTFLATASGGYRAASSQLVGSGVHTVALIDLNGDKILDAVVLSRTDKTVSVLLGKGDGTFKDPLVTSLPEVPVALAAGDLNGDGKTDLAIATDCGVSPCSQRGAIRLLLGSGDGSFRLGQAYAIGFSPVSIAVGALGKGGNLDLVVANRCGADATCKSVGSATVLAGDGKGGFTASTDMVLGSNLSSVALADLRGLGVLDLVVSQEGESSVVVMRGNGDRSFQSPTTYAVGNSPRSAVIADFDGDGHPDIAVSNFGDSTVGVLFGNGDGTFQTASTYAVGAGPDSLTAVESSGRPASLVTANGNWGAATLGTDITQLANVHPLVIPPAPTVVITSTTTSPFVYGDLLPALTVTVTGGTGSPQPDGTVTFSDTTNSASPVVLCTTGALTAGGSANEGTASCSTTTVLAGGPHSITAQYNAGASGNYSSALSQDPPLSQPVAAVTPTVSVATTPSTPASPQTYGTTLSFTATVTGVTTSGAAQPTGTVEFTDGFSGLPLSCTNASMGTVTLTTSATKSTATCTTAALTGGSHNIFPIYVPATTDENYLMELSMSTGYPFTVNTQTPTVTVTSTPASQQYVGRPATFKATVAATVGTGAVGFIQPTGTVLFTEGGSDIGCGPVTLAQSATNSTATCVPSTLSLGSHTIAATYTPSDSAVVPPFPFPTFVGANYASNSGTETPFSVISIPTNVTLVPVSNSNPPNAFQPNQTNVFTATIATTAAAIAAGSPQPGASDGTVTFQLSINGGAATTPCPSAPLVAGSAGATATCSISGFLVGNDVITATYNPPSGSHFAPTGPATSNQLVVKGSVIVTVGTLTATVNSIPTLSATVSVNSNAPTPSGGIVNFTAQFGTIVLCSVSLPSASSFTITGTSKSAPVSCTLSNPLTLAGNSSPGYPITVTYDGTSDINYSGGSGTGTLSVTKAATTVSIGPASHPGVINQPLTFTATVAPSPTPGQLSPTKGSVIFTANGGAILLCSLPVAPSVQCTYSGLPVTLPSGQPNTVVATYDGAGDPSFASASSTASASAAISPGTTQTVLSSSSSTNQSLVNQSVTFTANVTQVASAALVGTVMPTGTVAFMNGNQLLDSVNCPVATLSGSGVATCTTASLLAGSYSVTAVYTPAISNNIANFVTSTSAAKPYIVSPAATVVAVSPLGITTVNSPVTLMATISIASGGTAQPNGGTVVFTLNPVSLNPGSALTCTSAVVKPSLTVSCSSSMFLPTGVGNALQAGFYNVSAQYLPGSGDPNFAASSVSAPGVLTVKQATGTITLSPLSTTASPITVVATSPISFMATVMPTNGVPLHGNVLFAATGGDNSAQACQVPSVAIPTTSNPSNIATCSITFSKNASNSPFSVGASYLGDNNYSVAPMTETFAVQDFGIGSPAITYSTGTLSPAPAANIFYVTQGYSTDPGAAKPDPFFKGTISATTTAYSSYSRPVTYDCPSATGGPAGVACAHPSGTMAFATGMVSLSFSAASNTPAMDYTYQLTGTDSSISSLTRSSGEVIVRVAPVTLPISLASTANTTVAGNFQITDPTTVYSCVSVYNSTTNTLTSPGTGPFTCKVADASINSFNVGNMQVAVSQVPLLRHSSEISFAALLGVPLIAFAGFVFRKKTSGRAFVRFLGAILLACALLQSIGCGNGGGFTPPTPPTTAATPGLYLVQVSAKSASGLYYSVISVNVSQ